MKKVAIIFVFIFSLLLSQENVCDAKVNVKGNYKKAISAYKKLLSRKTMTLGEYIENWKTKEMDFKLCDIDGNGIPELLVTYNAAVTSNGFCHIFSYFNGKVKHAMYSYCSTFTIYKNGIVEDCGGRHGHEWKYYYKFNGKTCKKIASHEKSNPDFSEENYEYYKVNGKKVQKKKYEKAVKNLIKGKKKIEWTQLKKNTASNRKRYLK